MPAAGASAVPVELGGGFSGQLLFILTQVDAWRRGLLFERFLSLERAEKPDIDVDFDAVTGTGWLLMFMKNTGKSMWQQFVLITLIGSGRRFGIWQKL